MSNPYSAFCQDFYVNMRLNTQLNLPHNRETVLQFFERIQKEFPDMVKFRKHDNGDLNLEEDRGGEGYRWARLEQKRLVSGHVNPAALDDALRLHEFVLEAAPYYLGISPLELEYIEVLFGFDLAFRGNHDEIVMESLYHESPLNCLMEEGGAKAVDVQPCVAVALSDDCRLQARLDVITRTNRYQVRTGDYADDLISIYCTLRRYWGDRPKDGFAKTFKTMFERAETICSERVLPQILRPISSAISSRS